MLDIFNGDDVLSHTDGELQPQDQLFMTLSVAAVSEVPAPRTLCLHDVLQ